MSQQREPDGRVVAFRHVGLQVADLERSRGFYRDVIGLEEIERLYRTDAYLKAVTGYPEVELDIAVFEEPNSRVLLELLEYHGTSGAPIDPATANPGTAHMCFEVDDVDGIHRRALLAGHAAVNAPVTPTSGRWTDGRSVYLIDPDGIRVELVQRARRERGGSGEPIRSEEIYLVEVSFAADAAERRGPYRAQHLAQIAELIRSGVVVEGGAFLDALTASILLVRARSAADARRVVDENVYSANGVWREVSVRPFGRLLA